MQNRRQKFVVILSFSFLVASGLEYYYYTLFWHDVDVGIDIGRSGVYFFNKWRVGLGFYCVFFVLWFIVAFLISTVYILLLGWVGRVKLVSIGAVYVAVNRNGLCYELRLL